MSSSRKAAVAALALALLVVVLLRASWRDWLLSLIMWIRELGVRGAVVFALAYVAATVTLVPGAILTIAAGFLYGPWWGGALVLVASVLGASCSFLLARSWLRPWIQGVVSKRPGFRRLDERVEREGWKLVVLLRLSPLVPFSVLNYVLGMTRLSLRNYVLASAGGMIPGILLYAYIGSLASVVSELSAGASGSALSVQRYVFWAGLVATLTVSIVLMRWSRRALAAAPNSESSAS